jgi:HK97 family phage major capsid protein
MEVKELNDALSNLKTELEGKSKAEAKNAIDAFEVKFKEVVNNQVKSVQDEFEAKLKLVQEHADKLDVKLQEKSKAQEAKGDFLKNAIKANFEGIRSVEQGSVKKFRTEVKAVGDMTLSASLTGDQPRDYNFNVVSAPSPLVNVADLVGLRRISGGTYTYVRVVKGEGSISAQTEGSSKSQIDYDYSMVDVNTDFLAGFARYSKKMANNLPFLESSLPIELRRDYMIAENAKFQTVLAAAATASTLTAGNEIERLLENVSVLASANYSANGIVINPADYFKIITTEKSTGAGYGLPGVVSIDGGILRVNGIPVYQATWVAEDKKI